MFEQIGKIKLILGLIEESILKTLVFNKKYNQNLFIKFLKKTTYETLQSEFRQENVDFIISNLRLDYENSLNVQITINDDLSMGIEIPVNNIVQEIIKNNITEEFSNLQKDLNIIDEIWDQWSGDEFDFEIKLIINDIIFNLS